MKSASYSHETIVLRAKNRWFHSGVLLFFLGVWTAEFFLPFLKAVLSRGGDNPFAFGVLACIGGACGAVLLFACVWALMGGEVLEISAAHMTVSKKIGRLAVGHREVFDANEIRRMRLEALLAHSKGHKFIRHKLAFDYRGSRKVLFTDVSEETATSLLAGPLRIFTL